MRLLRHLVDMPFAATQEGTVVTIGSFDGLHLGHLELLQRVLDIAKEKNLTTVVMSFEPTPREFFQIERPPARLMKFREKFEALAAYGIDIFYCPRFSADMRSISAQDFVRRILVQGLNAHAVIVGDDFRFAHKREGDIAMISRMSKALGFQVIEVPSLVVAGQRASSTAIREACAAGDMALAGAMLGRPYQMSGRVIRGEEIGRTLGFPTANVDLQRRQSPLSGIFAVRVHGLEGGIHDGVASVGNRPTFDGVKPILEVFLFDFDRDIYGKYIKVDFVEYLRDQEKFPKVADLVAQMQIDADNARSILQASRA